MTRKHPEDLLDIDPEIDRTFHRNIRVRQQEMVYIVGEGLQQHNNMEAPHNVNEQMNENNQGNAQRQENVNGNGRRTMGDYARPFLTGSESSITRPTVDANNFEIKPNVIQMVQNSVQFDGLPEEDPNAHISNFLEVCDTFKINGASDDAIRLRLFPFTLRNRAKSWLKSLPNGCITNWNELAERFLAKHFPQARTGKIRNDVFFFQQQDWESLYEVWERYKEFLRKCPHHGLDLGLQMQTFHAGLNYSSKQLIDASSGGSTSSKNPEELRDLIENIAENNCSWGSQRMKPKISGIHNVDALSALEANMEFLTKMMDELSSTTSHKPSHVMMACDFCGGGHPNHECQSMEPASEHVDYLGGNRQQNNPYSNTYNPGGEITPTYC